MFGDQFWGDIQGFSTTCMHAGRQVVSTDKAPGAVGPYSQVSFFQAFQLCSLCAASLVTVLRSVSDLHH